MEPENLLDDKSSLFMDVNDPISVGIVPSKLLLFTKKTVHVNNCKGKVPSKKLKDKSKLVKFN